REVSDMPVIFLTSKEEEIDELCGLSLGADDFIRKPFSRRGLIERIKVLFRRTIFRNGLSSGNAKPFKAVQCGHLCLDPERHACTWKGNSVTLTVTEFLMLQALASHPGAVKSRNELMEAAYGDRDYANERTIDSHIKRLRRK